MTTASTTSEAGSSPDTEEAAARVAIQVLHRRPPTWAQELAGVDPGLLAPLQAVPDGWPYRPAFWRRELT